MAELESEVVEEIRRILREELEWKGSVEPSHDLLKDLQLDSLGLTVLAVGLENRFRVKLSEEDAVGLATVEDLAKRVVTSVAATPEVER